MVDGHNLVFCRHKLGVDGTGDGILDNLGPLLTTQLGLLLVDWLTVGLADLKHEGPVRTCLLLGVLCILTITLQMETAALFTTLQMRCVTLSIYICGILATPTAFTGSLADKAL